MDFNTIYNGDSLEILKSFPDESIKGCCVTSPPYYGLRDYGVDGQIGLEETPEKYIEKLVQVFREVKRVLTLDSTLWVNIGDTYAGNARPGGGDPTIGNRNLGGKEYKKKSLSDGLKCKDMIGIPWMLAFALRADGWYLRQDIIWAKPNPMPESVTDRCTKSHEYLFLLSKSPKYYFNHEAIKEPVTESTKKRMNQDIENQKGSSRVPGKTNGNMKAVLPRYGGNKYTANPDEFYRTKSGNAYDYRPFRNKRDVWHITTKPCKEAHFAVFPEDLIIPCVLSGCPEDGVVLDPFFGSGTSGAVAKKLGRKFVGIELNPTYCDIADRRIQNLVSV